MCRNVAECTCCKNLFAVDSMIGTAMPNRGGRIAYMCRDCASRNRYYHTSNTELQGKAKNNKVRVGWELESSYSDDYARNILFEYGMIPTNDSSLHGNRTCEYVSGRAVYMGYIRRFYHSLFIPLADAMRENPTKTKKLFGRCFTHYARDINRYTDADSRYNFINVTNDSNIEFRLNKFVTAKQSQELTKMEVEMVKCIVKNFCEHFMDTEWDRTRYEKRTHYRKHKADVTANKLVKLFEKYATNI